jgi:hypothetical protein
MAITTVATTLKSGATQGGPYTKLLEIISYPDLGSAPSKLDTTDLSATISKTSILGLQDVPDLSFEANYDDTAYTTILAMTGTSWFNLEFGSAGADGIFEWSGQIRIYAMGGGVDEVRKMTVVLSASTPVTFSATA